MTLGEGREQWPDQPWWASPAPEPGVTASCSPAAPKGLLDSEAWIPGSNWSPEETGPFPPGTLHPSSSVCPPGPSLLSPHSGLNPQNKGQLPLRNTSTSGLCLHSSSQFRKGTRSRQMPEAVTEAGRRRMSLWNRRRWTVTGKRLAVAPTPPSARLLPAFLVFRGYNRLWELTILKI